ncbi:DUF2638 domain containing protein [Blumeria hordei DH14]|uniref:DUF2638 domain containing protein n=1 Tax=Blumeria graminis f. sp. hordei (strain DH14) TaxID=546991 RepID=N1JC55_BLUG1|nr:DUF2638 domain containing protein [Blumeria hordei DH14]
MFSPAKVCRQALSTNRAPMIKFLGKRSIPKFLDHTPKVHPESPSRKLPDDFASYRQQAQQHGPLGHSKMTHSGNIGSMSGASLGSVEPQKGELTDFNQLPKRFRKIPIDPAEIDAIETGGAAPVC